MDNKIIALVFIVLLIMSCAQDKNTEFSTKTLTENDLEVCTDTPCPEITINYVKALGVNAEKINSKIEQFIIAAIEFGEDEKTIAKTINEAATNFARGYHNDKVEFPDMAGPYVAEISVRELFRSNNHISFEQRAYLFTGGAHGYEATSFLNIDPETGSELGSRELFMDKENFMTFAEEKFREQQNIREDQSINESGFWFENDTFYLPNTVGFTQNNLIFVYNQYDIASYADGPIELKIAKEEAMPFLTKR